SAPAVIRPAAPRVESDQGLDRIATPQPAGDLDLSGDRWLNRRLDDLACQLRQLQSEPSDNRNGALPSLAVPLLSDPKPGFVPRPVAALSDVATETERQLRSIDNGVRQMPIAAAPLNPIRPLVIPHSQPARSRESQEQQLSILGQKQTQPVPKIVPEDLPG